MGDTVVVPPTMQSHFDMNAFLTNLNLRMGGTDYQSLLASIPATSITATSLSLSPTNSQCSGQGRKRRRTEIANPANTLDGLVARRAEDGREEIGKRFMTENEAIESPDEQTELRRMETDPDVSTRTCSICGYQGKWVSEMIRHKRVHTNDRPFKCKYCSRTSKWKADLIRHVAKTHGIRVVSKYSRSKTFDVTSTNGERPDDERPVVFACEGDEGIEMQRQNSISPPFVPSTTVLHRPEPLTPTRPQRTYTYRCNACNYEQDALSLLLSHLHNQHTLSAYSCPCGISFETIDATLDHLKQGFPADHCSANFTTVYKKELSSLCVSTTLSPSARSDVSMDSGINTDSDDSEMEIKICSQCPFKCGSEMVMRSHNLGHETPKGPFNYKCVFCSWYNKRKSSIEDHMRVHTSCPQEYMGEVERNLITPATLASPVSLPFGLLSPMGSPLGDSRSFNVLEPRPLIPSTFDLASALLALQAQLSPGYMNMPPLMSSKSAFTPTAALSENRMEAEVPSNRCTLCEAVFSDSATLSSHLKFHGSGLRHACQQCNYAVSTEMNLVRHKHTHHRSTATEILVSLCELPEEDSEEEALNVEE